MGFAYEIRVRGRLSPTVLSQFEYLDSYELAEAPGPAAAADASVAHDTVLHDTVLHDTVPHDTVLHGTVPDQAALHGVLRQVGALGLDLVELRCPQPR